MKDDVVGILLDIVLVSFSGSSCSSSLDMIRGSL